MSVTCTPTDIIMDSVNNYTYVALCLSHHSGTGVPYFTNGMFVTSKIFPVMHGASIFYIMKYIMSMICITVDLICKYAAKHTELQWNC